jgi:hypothetical protein
MTRDPVATFSSDSAAQARFLLGQTEPDDDETEIDVDTLEAMEHPLTSPDRRPTNSRTQQRSGSAIQAAQLLGLDETDD